MHTDLNDALVQRRLQEIVEDASKILGIYTLNQIYCRTGWNNLFIRQLFLGWQLKLSSECHAGSDTEKNITRLAVPGLELILAWSANKDANTFLTAFIGKKGSMTFMDG